MKKKVFFLLSFVFLGLFALLGINSSTKTITASANNGYQDYNQFSATTFDHIDIQSVASFTYYVDGKPVKVNINFYEDNTNLSKINIYKKSADGKTLTEIPVEGKWQNQSGTSGNSSTDKEYRISGTFDRYYDKNAQTKVEVVYVVKFTLSVTIGGVEQELVYTEEYSYSSSNNVCPGDSTNKGIDVKITGEKLESYFSSSLKIVKNVENASDNTFTFNVKAVNENIDFDKDIQITTSDKTGFITLGGLTAGEQYIITEKNIPDGYELKLINDESVVDGRSITITAGKNQTVVVTFTNSIKTVDVTGTKTWNDNNDQDGIRPDKITVNLLKNGEKIDSVEVTAEDNWAYSFNDLAEYENGEKVVYTVTEDSVSGYNTTINNTATNVYDIANTHTPEMVSISGTKTWDDNDDQDGIRPESITVKLLADGKEVASKVVTAEDDWKYDFGKLAKYDNGAEITYTVEEVSVDGYVAEVSGYDITNTHTPSVISISGSKTWEDKDNQDRVRPESITVRLLANGEEVDSVIVTAENDWSYEFSDLPEYKNGSKLEYTIKEDSVEGYTTVINGYDITNIHEIETTTVSGTKTWNDNNNQDGIRPESITVRLYADGEEVDSVVVTAEDKWSYTFENLDKNADGKEIVYTVAEDSIDGYTTKVSGYNITNTHITETTKVMGKKIWNDNNNQDGIRPESITVRLLADGQEVNSLVVTEGENKDWTYAFIDLPKYKNGKEIEYSVVEDDVEGYTTSYYKEDNSYIIVNTHQTETIDVTGTKTWDDNNNQDGFRPESITVRLYADGQEIDSITVTEADDWSYNFTGLDKYKDGREISYTINEDAVENYSTTIDGYNITNTHTPVLINVSGIKTWDDNDNQDGVRPEYIIVNLLKNGEVSDTLIVNEKTNWEYSFLNLNKYENGKEIEYTLTEETVDGYKTEINGYDITNTHEIEKITFKATKIWDDNDNQDGIRPESIIVRLFADGEEIDSVEVTEADNWTYEFNDLDRYKNGTAIVYTVVEDIVLGYDTAINYDDIDENNIVSATIKNTHTPEQTKIEINKIWNDSNNVVSSRPNSIEVDLYADGEFLKTLVITDKENWKYIIDGLDKYKDGKEIVYTISEKAVAGYTTTYDGFNITNTLEFGKGGDVEVLPPQTGVNETSTNLLFSIVSSLIAGLFLVIKKFI